MATIYILWLRQLKKYFRSKSRIIGSLGQPLLFLIAFGYGFGSIYQKAGDGNYIQFLAPGIVCMSVLFTAIFSGIDLIWDRQFGFLKETLVAPVSRFQIVLGKTLGGATVALIQGLLVLALTLFVGYRPHSVELLLASVFFMFLIALLFTCLGVVIASILEDMQGFQMIMNFLVMPIVFLSGAFFPLEGLPKPVYFVAKIDPLSYGVSALRAVMTGTTSTGLLLDFIVLSSVTLCLLLLGSYLFEKIQA
jgi:ABC-2 type transport system permease protein